MNRFKTLFHVLSFVLIACALSYAPFIKPADAWPGPPWITYAGLDDQSTDNYSAQTITLHIDDIITGKAYPSTTPCRVNLRFYVVVDQWKYDREHKGVTWADATWTYDIYRQYNVNPYDNPKSLFDERHSDTLTPDATFTYSSSTVTGTFDMDAMFHEYFPDTSEDHYHLTTWDYHIESICNLNTQGMVPGTFFSGPYEDSLSEQEHYVSP